jgi:hypothetical protein
MVKNSFFAGLSLAVTSALANPSTLFDVPYQPTPAVEAIPDRLGAWTEIYLLNGPPAAALRALSESGKTPPALGIAADSVLYVSVKGKHLSIPETGLTVSRDRAPVEYLDDCTVIPQVGDTFAYTFETPGLGQLTVVADVLEHFAFGRVSELMALPVRLDLAKPSHCDAVEESRLVLVGTLRYADSQGAALRVPVVLQYVVLR